MPSSTAWRRILSLTETRNSDIYTISYSNPDPRAANRVVEAVLNLLVERSLGESRKDSRATRDFLVQQIREHEQRMEQAETRIKEFKQQNMGLMPGSGQSHFSRQEAQRAQIQEAVLQLQEAERRRDEVKKQLQEVDESVRPRNPGGRGLAASPPRCPYPDAAGKHRRALISTRSVIPTCLPPSGSSPI